VLDQDVTSAEIANGVAEGAHRSPHWHRLAVVAGGLVRRVELLRLAFGLVWLTDAYLKWQPAFVNQYAASVADRSKGQPAWLRPWFRLWRHVTDFDPHLLEVVSE